MQHSLIIRTEALSVGRLAAPQRTAAEACQRAGSPKGGSLSRQPAVTGARRVSFAASANPGLELHQSCHLHGRVPQPVGVEQKSTPCLFSGLHVPQGCSAAGGCSASAVWSYATRLRHSRRNRTGRLQNAVERGEGAETYSERGITSGMIQWMALVRQDGCTRSRPSHRMAVPVSAPSSWPCSSAATTSPAAARMPSQPASWTPAWRTRPCLAGVVSIALATG